MADKTFIQLQGNVGEDPEDTNKNRITKFSLAVNQGYGDDAPPAKWYTINAWDNDRDDRGDFRQWIKDNLHRGSKGVYVEGFLTEKPGNTDGKVFRDVSVSRIGLVEYAERSKSAVAAGSSSDDGDY